VGAPPRSKTWFKVTPSMVYDEASID
jgi:hypothetical protein